jgi:hypothetical protein
MNLRHCFLFEVLALHSTLLSCQVSRIVNVGMERGVRYHSQLNCISSVAVNTFKYRSLGVYVF